MNEYLIPGLEPEEALDVLDDGSAELLGGGGGLDLVDHSERGGLEAPPRVRGHGRGVRVRRHGLGHRRALADVHHGHPREREPLAACFFPGAGGGAAKQPLEEGGDARTAAAAEAAAGGGGGDAGIAAVARAGTDGKVGGGDRYRRGAAICAPPPAR